MTDGNQPPIIIIKKKKAHHGHHGGAWKVAYADFVTAMMALFIVLWLLSSSEKVKKAVGGYFLDPAGVGKDLGSALAGVGESLSIARDDMPLLKEKIEAAIKSMPELKSIEDQIQITVTGEGLRIELLENEKGLFFESGSPKPQEKCVMLLTQLAKELCKLPNMIVLEGHTDAKPYSNDLGYTNWELSADRANAGRRLMMAGGIKPDQVVQVRGFGDRQLLKRDAPLDASNRRISIIVQYLTPKPGEVAAAKESQNPNTAAGSAHHASAKPVGAHAGSAPTAAKKH